MTRRRINVRHGARGPARVNRVDRLLGVCVLLMLPMGGVVSSAWQRPAKTEATAFSNVQITHTGTYEESALAVNPANPKNLLGIAMFAANASAPGSQPATFSSLDAGVTWQENGPLPLPKGFENGVDPTVAFSSRGHGFLSYRLDGAGEVGARPEGIFVWRTDDGGRTFGAPQAAYMSRGTGIDHPWIAAAKTETGADNLYLVWTMEVDGQPNYAAFSRSTDDGRRFESSRKISGSHDRMATNPVMAAGPEARVHVIYTGLSSGQSLRAGPKSIEVVNSSDGGQHFDDPRIIANTLTLAGTVARMSTSPAVAVDARTDAVYVAYAVLRSGTEHTDIAVVSSTDHGQNWSHPTLVASSPLTMETDYFQPSAAVSPTGIVCVSYYVVTNVSKDLNQSLVDEYLSCSANHGMTFDPALRITSAPFKYGLGNRFTFHGVEFSFFGDYQGIAASPTAFHVVWADSRPGRPTLFTAAVPIERLEKQN